MADNKKEQERAELHRTIWRINAILPIDKEQAKKLSKRVYKNAMTALSTGASPDSPQALPCG